jgi:hypothetical protein
MTTQKSRKNSVTWRRAGKRRPRAEASPRINWLGEFANFPTTVHGIGRIAFTCRVSEIKQAIVETMQELDGREQFVPLSVSGLQGELDGKMGFEVGAANGMVFERLNDAMALNLIEYVSKNDSLRVLDFMLIATYHYHREKRQLPVRFDHHHIRFSFLPREKVGQVLIHHIRGTRRLPLDELLQTIFDGLQDIAERDHLGAVRSQVVKAF